MLVFKSRTKKFVKRAVRTVCALLLAGAAGALVCAVWFLRRLLRQRKG